MWRGKKKNWRNSNYFGSRFETKFWRRIFLFPDRGIERDVLKSISFTSVSRMQSMDADSDGCISRSLGITEARKRRDVSSLSLSLSPSGPGISILDRAKGNDPFAFRSLENALVLLISPACLMRRRCSALFFLSFSREKTLARVREIASLRNLSFLSFFLFSPFRRYLSLLPVSPSAFFAFAAPFRPFFLLLCDI